MAKPFSGPVETSHRFRSNRWRLPLAVCVTLAISAAAACDREHLRGEVSPSDDGNTYLVVEDDNGGRCGDLIVDGEVWPHPVGATGRISPGAHTIRCGSPDELDGGDPIQFRIPNGVVFRFDYWGP